MAVGRSFLDVPWAELVYFTDARFWGWYHAEIRGFGGRIVTAANPLRVHPPDDRIEFVRNTGSSGLDLRPGCVRLGNNSGYAAINLAVTMGSREIYLLGYDLYRAGNRVHYHPEHPATGNLDKMGIFFPSMVEPLREVGAVVKNASPRSRIEVFPKIEWSELPCW